MIQGHKAGFYEKYIKRPQDVILAVAALIMLSPLIGILAVLVGCKMGTPVIFRQARPGLGGKVFYIYKFRMRKVMKLFICVIEWLFVKILQPFFYRKQYLKGKWFESITALGWRWAATDIVHRILFQTNLGVPWPVSPYMKCGNNIEFHVDDINNFQGAGNYFQTFAGKITIGKGTYIAQNVGIITANHDLMEPDVHQQGKEVILGEKCWIGMNAVILPGVKLGDHTVVGAGSVVTKSFEEGYCVVAGNPGRQIRRL